MDNKLQPGAITLEKLEKKYFPKKQPQTGTIIGHAFPVDNLLHNQAEVFDTMAQAKNLCNEWLSKWNLCVGSPNHSMQGSKPTHVLLSFEIQLKKTRSK